MRYIETISLPLLHSGRGLGGMHDSMTGMSEAMFRNLWIGIGIVAAILTAYGFYVMRRKSRK